MKLQDRYDWIVVGDGFWALLSGCLAARLGLRVLFVEVETPERFGQASGGQFFWRQSTLVPVFDQLKDILRIESKDEPLWQAVDVSVANRSAVYRYSHLDEVRERENRKCFGEIEWAQLAPQTPPEYWRNWINS